MRLCSATDGGPASASHLQATSGRGRPRQASRASCASTGASSNLPPDGNHASPHRGGRPSARTVGRFLPVRRGPSGKREWFPDRCPRRPAVTPGAACTGPDSNGEGIATATTFELNGKQVSTSTDPASPLLYVLRDEFDIQGARFGCGLGECGACTVLVGGVAERSCSVPVASVHGKQVTTLEGLGSAEKPSVLQQAFIDESAAQCGYCINGMIMQSASFLKTNPHPTEAEVKQALAYNMCRCGTHVRIVNAVLRAAAHGGV